MCMNTNDRKKIRKILRDVYVIKYGYNFGEENLLKFPKIFIISNIPFLNACGGAVTSWLVRSFPDRVVRVCILATDHSLRKYLSNRVK